MEAAATPGLSVEASRRTFDQVMALWVQPELDRRSEAGLLPSDFVLTAAQVILPNNAAPFVRLNDEVIAAAIVPLTEGAHQGQHIDLDEMEISEIALTDVDDDAGHFTLIARRDGWAMAFDGRRNIVVPRKKTDIASEFLSAAEADLAASRLRAAADAMFSAVELLVEAELTLVPLEGHLGGRATHRWVQTAINRRRKANNTRPENATLLNRLTVVRGIARYSLGEIGADELQTLMREARAMEQLVRSLLPRRVHVDPTVLALKPKPPTLGTGGG